MRTRPFAISTTTAVQSPVHLARMRGLLSVAATIAAVAMLYAAGARAGDVPPPPPNAAPPPAQMGEGMHSPGMGEHFKDLDKDGNGSLSRAEVTTGAPRMAEHFDEIDTNKDGSISREEMHAAHEKMHGNMHDHRAERFDAADTDKNGALSKAEVTAGLPRLAPQFDTIDTDKNGELSRTELDAWHRAKMQDHRPE